MTATETKIGRQRFDMTKSNSKFKKEGDFIAALRASEEGLSIEKKLGKDAVKMDKLLPLCSDEEIRKLRDILMWDLLRSDDPEVRNEELKNHDKCPCCDRWLGHNRPPAEDDATRYRGQGSFKF